MGKLTEEAKEQLGIIHKCEVLKVLLQMKIVCEQIENIDEMKDFSKQEATELVKLLEKYHKLISSIK